MHFDYVVGVDVNPISEDHHVTPYSNFEFVSGTSPQVLEQFGEGEFDICYIDADHNEEPCYADIVACQHIVKPDGWLAGHDWQWHDVQRAVRRAVGNARVHIFTDMSWLVKR